MILFWSDAIKSQSPHPPSIKMMLLELLNRRSGHTHTPTCRCRAKGQDKEDNVRILDESFRITDDGGKYHYLQVNYPSVATHPHHFVFIT